MNRRFDYREVSLLSKDHLDTMKALGAEGWELVETLGMEAIFRKELSPHEAPVKSPERGLCANCDNFPGKTKEDVGKCKMWGINVQGDGSECETFKTRTVEKVAPMDDLSAWHWQPRTDVGEKRVEAITTQDGGISSLPHKHRVVAIISRDGKVVRGKTDMISGHYHPVLFVGMAEESDGHTHAFAIPAKVE